MLNENELEKFNVFLIVHLDYYEPDGADNRPGDISKIYENIKLLNEYCNKTGEYLFVSKTYREFSYIKQMNLFSNYVLIEDAKKITEAISKITRIPLSKLNIGFGGFKWDACVRDWYINLVENPIGFDREFIQNWRRHPSELKENQKIKSGEIILELTDFSCQN